MAQKSETINFTMRHGHTDDKVLVAFPQPVPNLQLTLEQAEAFIEAMRGSMERLRAHMARPKN